MLWVMWANTKLGSRLPSSLTRQASLHVSGRSAFHLEHLLESLVDAINGFDLLHKTQVQLLKSDEPLLNITRITKVNLVLEKEEDDQPEVLCGFYAVCKSA